MRYYSNNLNVDIEVAKNNLSIINQIKTAELFNPSINFWEQQHHHYYDTNSSNSSEKEVNMDEYLSDQSNISKQPPQRSVSLSEQISNLLVDVSDLTNQNVQFDNISLTQVLFDYSDTQLLPSTSTQNSIHTSVETPFTIPSSNTIHSFPQYNNTEPMVSMHIPLNTQLYDIYNSSFPMPVSEQSTSSLSAVMNFDQNRCFSYPAFDPFAPCNQVVINETQPNTYTHPKLNDLNALPISTSITKNRQRESRHSLSSINIPCDEHKNRLKYSQSVPIMTSHATAVKRPINSGSKDRPRKKSMTEKEKRLRRENDLSYHEFQNEFLKSQVSVLENDILRVKELLRQNGVTIPVVFDDESM